MSKLIIGCGYLGLRVAKRWLAAGERVQAVTRSAERAERLRAEGIEPVIADVTRPETLSQLPAAATVLYAVGFDRSSGPDKREVYVQGLQNVLDHLPPETGRLIYVSSSGVYGQQSGEDVDEDSPCEPASEGGQIVLDAETALRAHPTFGAKAIILRLTGIYGPGRVPRQESLRRGEPIAVPTDSTLNLIHVDDAATAVLAAEKVGQPGRLYLVTDDEPVNRVDYYALVAQLIGAPPPTIIPPSPESPVAERAKANKRVKNDRLKQELGVALQYPTYRQGLQAILQDV